MKSYGDKFPSLTYLKALGIKVLIFDLDGTLLDSMNIWNKVDIDFLGRFGYEVDAEYTNVVKRVSIDDAALYTKQRYNLPLSTDEIKKAWNDAVEVFYREEAALKPGASEYISMAFNEGFTLAVATALTRVNAVNSLRHTGILDKFSCVITLEDMHSKVDKTSPDIFNKALDYVNASAPGSSCLPSSCLVFEDVYEAALGAGRGGFKTCAVFDPIGSGESWTAFCNGCNYAVKDWQDL